MESRLTGLDGLRGVAALVVLVMHTRFGLQGGHLAVDFFFMLSGYVMARTYEVRLQKGEIAPGRFILGRFKRFWPVMALGATLGVIAMLAHSGPSLSLAAVYLAALLLIPSGPETPYLLNLPAWSIFYELVANAVHALFLFRTRISGLLIILAVSGVGLVVATLFTGFPRILAETSSQQQFLVVFRLVFSYVAGILIFRQLRDRQPVKLSFVKGACLLPMYVMLVAVYPFRGWQFPFIFLIGPLMMISGLDRNAPDRIATALGKMSFPLYALHFPIMQWCRVAGVRSPFVVELVAIAIAALWLVPWRGFVPTVIRRGTASNS